MKRLVKLLPFVRDRKGATAIEYGLIAGFIAIAIVGAVTTIGSITNGSFNEVSQKAWGA